MRLLVDPAYVEPPSLPDRDILIRYMDALRRLVQLTNMGLMTTVSTEADVWQIYSNLCEGCYSFTVRGSDDQQLFCNKDVRMLLEGLMGSVTWIEREPGIENLDQFAVNSIGQRDPVVDRAYKAGSIEKSRDKLLAGSAMAQGVRDTPVSLGSCLVPADGPLDTRYAFAFRLRDKDATGQSERASMVRGTTWLASSLDYALLRSGLENIWMEAVSSSDRRYVLERRIDLYRSTPTGRSQLPHWDFLNPFFEESASSAGVTREPSKARALLESMAATVCSDLAQRKHHAWRTKIAADAPQQTEGAYRAWRRPCGNGLWLKWWETAGDILFATVSGHDDFSQLPPVGDRARRATNGPNESGMRNLSRNGSSTRSR